MSLFKSLLMLFFLCTYSVYSQIDTDDIEEETSIESGSEKGTDPEYSVRELNNKLSTYTKMHSTGRNLLFTGIPLTVAGATCLVSGISIIVNSFDESGVLLYMMGAYGIGFGIPLMITGGVLKGIGGNKMNEYQRRLDRVSFRFLPNAITFEYNF